MMKKNLLLLTGVLISFALSAQNYLLETFDTSIPATWTTVDNSGGGNWAWQDNGGQGIVLLDSDGFGNDGQAEDADLITSTIDCSGATDVYISVKGFFRQYNASIGTMSVSNDDGATWTSVATVNTSNADDIVENISAIAAGSATVKVKFNYVGSYDYYWVLDEVKVYTPANEDATMISLDNGIYIDANGGAVSFTGEMSNSGLSPITSFDINYSVGGGAMVTNTISGVNIPFGGSYTYTHPDAWTPVVGTQMVDISIGNVNGVADGNLADNATSKEFTVYDVAVQRVPLFEFFTASTCPPCTPANENFHNIVDPQPRGDYATVKYQQFGPGTGDPYCTDEAQNRYAFYYPSAAGGGYSIPRLDINGGWGQNGNNFTQALYDEAVARPAFLELDATYHVDAETKTATIRVNGKSIQDYPASDYGLYVVIAEIRTDANVKSNGETEFFNVMKKMLPDETGTTITSLANNTEINETFEYTFNGDYRLPNDGQAANRIDHATEHSVEEFTDLEVAVWVQDRTGLTVLQAAHAKIDSDNDGFSDEEEVAAGSDPNDPNGNPGNVSIKDVENVTVFNVFPNPTTDVINVEIQTNDSENIIVELVDVLGRTIETTLVSNNVASFNASKLNGGIYLVNVKSNGKSIATSSVVVR